MVVEVLTSAMLAWAPPAETETETGASSPEGEVVAEEGEPELPDQTEGEDLGTADVDAVVEAALEALEDRAWLERNGQEIAAYVEQLDALANVVVELDGCGRAIQAEVRMALALAYLKVDGSCSQSGDKTGEEVEVEDELPLPVLECFEASGPSECADQLLDHVAEFAAEGQGGLEAPFSQAFGCPHAVAEMSVEQMFGGCMVDEYDAASARWERSRGIERDDEVEVWPVPRWASITGVGVGAGLVIGGAVLLAINGKCPGGYDPVTEVDQCPSVYNTDVGGGVMLGVGTVAMLGMGTVLAITEVQRAKQGRTRETALRRRIDRAERLTGFRLSLPRPRLGLRP